MSEQNEKPQAPAGGAQPAAAATSPKGFERAENALAAGNEDLSARSKEAVAGMENRPGEDRASKADEAGAVTRRSALEQGDTDEKVDQALDEKAIEEGVEAAEDSSHVGWDLTPHNI